LQNKPRSTFGAIVYLAVAAGVFALLLSRYNAPAPDNRPPARSDTITVDVPAEIEEDVRAAQGLLRTSPDLALTRIERALRRAPDAPPELRAVLNTWAADVHLYRWHLQRARDALNRAIELAPTDTRRRQLMNVEEAIRRSQGERGLAQFYYASRKAGPAAELGGRVVVGYVFVDPRGIGRWTDLDRVFARNTLDRVERWYSDKAVARGNGAPVFVDRIFEVPLAEGDLPVTPNALLAYRTAWLLANNLGYDSVGAFVEALARQESADQAMFIVHSPQDTRSFAVTCNVSRSYCEGEVAFVFAPTGPNAWDTLATTLAHEGLHLFGADDLYNIAGADDYAPTDIMHYRSSNLQYADVGDLTAWAVGWARARPNTPFVVEE